MPAHVPVPHKPQQHPDTTSSPIREGQDTHYFRLNEGAGSSVDHPRGIKTTDE